MATLKNTVINATGFLQLPAGTTAQRPASPTAGMLRFNTSLDSDSRAIGLEHYNGSAWVPYSANPEQVLNNPTITYFTAVGNTVFNVPTGVSFVEVLVVAGGGGGGGLGGGGGAGGLIYKPEFPVTPGGTIPVTVGSGGAAGGSAAGTNGNPSVFGTLTAVGGGVGGSWPSQPNSGPGGTGGSGGGSSNGYGANTYGCLLYTSDAADE